MNLFLGKILGSKDLVQVAIISSFIYFIMSNFNWNFNYKMLVFTNFFLTYYFYTKIDLSYCFVAFALTMAIKVFAESLVVTIINVLGFDLNYIFSIKILKILVSSLSSIILLIFYSLLRNKDVSIFNVKNKKIKIGKYLKILSIILGYLIMLVSTIAIFYIKDSFDNYGNIIFLFVVVLCFISMSFLVVAIFTLNKNKNIKEIESNLMNKNLLQMEDTIDLLRTQKHDYMNHLQIILMQVSKDNSEGAKNYIQGMINNESIDALYYNTGCDYIDAILNVKRSRATRHNIEFTACVDSSLECSSLLESEISAVILNIVDNAIDELKDSTSENKYIHVDIFDEDKIHYISIKNNGSMIKNVEKIFEIGYSSKGSSRGYGLYSIKNLLSLHGCDLNVLSDEDETEFEVVIPMN